MAHRIIINNLGPIEHVDMQVDDFMIFTGPQASGKSTIAKAIYLFRSVKDDLYRLILRKWNEPDLTVLKTLTDELAKKMFLTLGLASFNPKEQCKEVCGIEYYYSESVYLRLHDISTGHFEGVFEGLGSFLEEPAVEDAPTYGPEDGKKLRAMLDDLFCFREEPVFIPADRSFLTLLSSKWNHIYMGLDDREQRELDFGTHEYIKLVAKIRNSYGDKKEGIKVPEITKKILKGSYLYNVDTRSDYLIHERRDGGGTRGIAINYASSGQQESLWILNILSYYLAQQKPAFFIIEEPESHLFPETQDELMRFIALVKNAGHQVLITTHSPYVLGSVNNLLYAHQVGQKAPDETAKIIPPEQWLDPDTFAGYFVEDGRARDAVDEETRLFQNEVIDKASENINAAFDALLELNYSGAEEEN